MKELQNLVGVNPKVGALGEFMLKSEANTSAGSIDYLNKFEVIKDLLLDLKIDVADIGSDDYEKLCPLLMNAILLQNTKIEMAPRSVYVDEAEYIDMNPLDPDESRRLDDLFLGFKDIETLDQVEMIDRYRYPSTFTRMPRLERLVLATVLITAAQSKSFEPLPFWVKLVDNNGNQED